MNIRFRFIAAVLGGLLAIPASTFGETHLDLVKGWGGKMRAGKWGPLYVTVSDPTPRNVLLELRSPHDGTYTIVIHQQFTIGPQPATFPLYVPEPYGTFEQSAVVLRDLNTGKMLARYPEDPNAFNGVTSYSGNDSAALLVGVSGRRTNLTALQEITQPVHFNPVYMEPTLLPDTPAGYDTLDVLFLNQPNLDRMSDATQRAIAAWVRAGGNLVLSPSANAIPQGALADLLPCRPGGPVALELTDAQLSAAGLPRRFRKMTARALEPAPGAEPIALFPPPQAQAYTRTAGLGRVTVLPLDVVGLQFEQQAQSAALWGRVFTGMMPVVPATGDNPQQPQYYGPGAPTDPKELAASQQLANFLGNVPGAGRFGFSYVAIVLIGMMLVVGPVDWFVLKKLGAQPWTWVTTSGWIVLVTLGAIYIGHLFKSGDLHFRSTRVIDQVDDGIVAATDFTCLYSPRTKMYDIRAAAQESWMQPISPASGYYSRGTQREVEFHQTDHNNTPEPQLINVWDLRFLRGDASSAEPPVLACSLTLSDGPQPRIVGTIKNLSNQTLRDIHIRTKFGVVKLSALSASATQPSAEIAPLGECAVNLSATGAPFKKTPANANGEPYNYYGYSAVMPNEDALWAIAGDLAPRRSARIDSMIGDKPDYACVYVQVADPAPPVTLMNEDKVVEKHYEWIRALVRLHP